MKIILLTLVFAITTLSFGKEETPIKTTTLPEVVITAPTTQQEIFNTVIEQGYDTLMAKLIVAQAMHESGNFKSKLFRKGNNAFGMMRTKKDTLAIGSMGAEKRSGYAVYEDVNKSTIAVLQLLERKGCGFKFNSAKEYAKWLKSKGYYEDTTTNYVRALQIHLRRVRI